jgi:hypothetical protein
LLKITTRLIDPGPSLPYGLAQDDKRGAKNLTASDEFDDLEGVAFFEEGGGVGGLGEDFAIALDGHSWGRDLQALEKLSDGSADGKTEILAVDMD